MSTAHLLHPAYRLFLDEQPEPWNLATLGAIRARLHSGFTPRAHAQGEEHWVPHGPRLRLYRPGPKVVNPPLVVYLHGGGFVLGCPEMADNYLNELALAMGVAIAAVDYRLAPEHPFPAPLDDCEAVLRWAVAHADTLGIGADTAVLMGHSAGGGLAAALALRHQSQPCCQLAGLVMIYPMLDHRTGAPGKPLNPNAGAYGWSAEPNHFCWECLRGDYTLDDDRLGEFSPALAPSLAGLPPTFIAVGALDLFVDEAMSFALRLSHAGVPVEARLYAGVPHLFDQYPGPVTDQCVADTRAALGTFLGGAVQMPR